MNQLIRIFNVVYNVFNGSLKFNDLTISDTKINPGLPIEKTVSNQFETDEDESFIHIYGF